jgi:hypothetical protein
MTSLKYDSKFLVLRCPRRVISFWTADPEGEDTLKRESQEVFTQQYSITSSKI